MRVMMMAMVLVVSMSSMAGAQSSDKQSVIQVITDAYVNGVHARPDATAMRRGFHPAFRMLVLTDGKMSEVTLDDWAARVEKASSTASAARPAVTAEFPTVEVTGTVASARVELFRDGRHTFTDQLLLYKFADGWKIVSKAFYAHPR